MIASRRHVALSLTLFAAAALILYLMGRNPLCTCGRVDLWGAVGPEQSQMLFDWYSLSHLVHGFAFYALLAWLAPRWDIRWRFTAALGYEGDSILNSLSDIAMMAIGFVLARKLPLWASVALVVMVELIPLLIIRDNLTLNVWMLLWPTDWLRDWQTGVSPIN